MSRFNIRVYGLWLTEDANKVLISDELIAGKRILKFPGGGVEWGEGLIDALKREWKEELNTRIDILKHFYTTDFFQLSAFDDSQVISIYYLVRPMEVLTLPYTNEKDHFHFIPVDKNLEDLISLPIDKVIAKKLFNKENQ